MIHFTSDTHFSHSNVIRYCNRPYRNFLEMDNDIIERWNEKVKPGDTVYHLGDFAFAQADRISEILDKLNGQIFLVYGNHDKTIRHNRQLQQRFVKCSEYMEVKVQDPTAMHGTQLIVLSHYAFLVWNKSHYGSWHLHGHSHGSLKYPFTAKLMDVGVDCNGYAPISYDEVKEHMSKITFTPVDHHE